MSRLTTPNPYCGFKDDRERRRALNTRVRCYTLAIVVTALTGSPIDWTRKLQWLITWLH